jgi:hypothetical protein
MRLMTWRALFIRPYLRDEAEPREHGETAVLDVVAQVESKPKLESTSSHFSFKR